MFESAFLAGVIGLLANFWLLGRQPSLEITGSSLSSPDLCLPSQRLSLTPALMKTIELDKYQREVLNTIVRYAKDVVKARKHWNRVPKPPLLMVHGGAGAGKSTVIHVITFWTHKILRQEGDSLDQPHVIKTAFTGCAAANIEGQTLHGTFGFSFNNQHFSLNDKMRDQKRALMKNLQLMILLHN